jgi:D-serine deaminase-like pyridoxal phosphate-dependent protein
VSPYYKSAPGTGTLPAAEGELVFDGGMLSPIMVCREQALRHNIETMARYCRDAGLRYAPHAKTTMSPELVAWQLAAGAWGVSAATVSQVRAFREFGAQNVLLANELVDRGGIAWVVADLRDHPDRGFLCYVDSVTGVDLLQRALAGTGVVLDVLLEVGPVGGRTGCRTLEAAHHVAARAAASPTMRLVGVAGYEGCIGSDRKPDTLDAVRRFCDFIGSTARHLDQADLLEGDEVILSAGGGVYFDVVVEQLRSWRSARRASSLIIRPGSYISHDDGLYAHISAFAQQSSAYRLRPTLELWGRVLSRPERELAFLDFGRRDAPFDQGLPLPHTVRDFYGGAPRHPGGFVITALNDQHAYLTVPADDPLAPGDWIGCGISHPCTAFDKWHYLPRVDEDYRVIGPITTYF